MFYRKSILIVVFSILSLIITLTACRKDDLFNEDASFKLDFSLDTVHFDTVFTTIGSVTKQLKVYNRSVEAVKISQIFLPTSTQSSFRINVDGIAGTSFNDVIIEAEDSLFIFVEVTVDPNNTNIPMVVTDSIVFKLNRTTQYVNLLAYGRDAYFHVPTHPATEYLPAYSLASGTWPNDKPHVIYGYLFIYTDSVLEITQGTEVYLHYGANIWVYDGGSLKVNGTLNNEVIIKGDRLDQAYKDLPGQWGRIWLSAGSIDNEINYAIIENGTIGIHADTLGNSSNPTLRLKNTIINNMSIAGIYAQGSYIEAENCLVSNCGYYGIALTLGGSYDFRHITIGNFWESTRETPSLVLNNYYEAANGSMQYRDLTNAYFANCIIWGDKTEEILFDNDANALFNYQFDHCLLKTENPISNPTYYVNCIKNQNPKFENDSLMDFRLQSSSPAINIGSSTASASISLDLAGNPRIQGTAPDLGAYESAN